jgi:ABC-type uncharacterized transport system permease subunit
MVWGLLTVNFRQPSHKFTFGVGIDLISKLTILTLMIYQVRTRMWFLEFIVYPRIKHINENFQVQFNSPSTLQEDHEARYKSRHEVNMTPNDPRTEA